MKTHLLARSALSLAALGAVACGTDASSYDSSYQQSASATAPAASKELVENDWVDTSTEPTSTFGADVDTASYSIMRRDVTAGKAPDPSSVRPEEYLNYFSYDYAQPQDARPFAVHLDGAPSPFGENLHLIRVGLQGRKVDVQSRKRMNLVFLVDVSGSMLASNKLGPVQYTLKQLVRRLEPTDTLSIVTYAGQDSVLIEPTAVTQKARILDAIDGMSSGGSTNGAGGIRRAYQLAEAAKQQDAGASESRVVLCTDGDFNVGETGDALVALIERERDKGVTLTALGFGEGNYNDRDMEKLADHGNGNYAYIDNAGEANRVLGEKLVSTLQVIAKDVKIQIAFQPDAVRRYRLIGYENRVLANQDFNDDKKDAGDLGAGHTVTAFYEVELTGAPTQAALANVSLRYKEPNADTSTEFGAALPLDRVAPTLDGATPSFRFAAATVEYAEILRHSKHSTGARFDEVVNLLQNNAEGRADRQELVTLAMRAKSVF